MFKDKQFSNGLKLTFYGGTGSVTGANFLLESKGGLKILIDCGLMQGTETSDSFNRDPFPYNPEEIDFLIVTHAHMDHTGRIPKLVKDGFKGKIISTPPTKDIAEVLFDDAIGIMDSDSRKNGVLPMYDRKDAEKALSLWETIPYHQTFGLGEGISTYLRDSGHILGSAMVEIDDGKMKAIFTGDLGNSPSLLLNDTEEIKDANYIIMESVYGDRNHEPKEERRRQLKDVIRDTIANKKLLIIPAFSLERTQMILYEMNTFFENNELSQVPVFLDSPLAIKITKIYKKYCSYMNEAVCKEIKEGDDIFSFPRLKSTALFRDSERIDLTQNPKIIIAGSGMSSGGRVVHHEHDHVGNKNATILLIGYQAVGTLGRKLEDGAKTVNIYGDNMPVRATIAKIEGYSSHKDSDHLVEFVDMASKAGKLKKVFAVMGEPKASLFLVQRLRDEIDVNAEYPEYGESVELV
ncbi:MAG: MBL fold metallo-hydrolase [Candidatus Paceibacterota bacterium]|jgi:metallo-beta-lactamase family protein